MLTLAKQLAISRPLECHHDYLVISYKTQYYNVMFVLAADVILVKLHHEILKHKPSKSRHVDFPPDSDHLRLDWLELLTFFLCVSFVLKCSHLFPYPVFPFLLTFIVYF